MSCNVSVFGGIQNYQQHSDVVASKQFRYECNHSEVAVTMLIQIKPLFTLK